MKRFLPWVAAVGLVIGCEPATETNPAAPRAEFTEVDYEIDFQAPFQFPGDPFPITCEPDLFEVDPGQLASSYLKGKLKGVKLSSEGKLRIEAPQISLPQLTPPFLRLAATSTSHPGGSEEFVLSAELLPREIVLESPVPTTGGFRAKFQVPVMKSPENIKCSLVLALGFETQGSGFFRVVVTP